MGHPRPVRTHVGLGGWDYRGYGSRLSSGPARNLLRPRLPRPQSAKSQPRIRATGSAGPPPRGPPGLGPSRHWANGPSFSGHTRRLLLAGPPRVCGEWGRTRRGHGGPSGAPSSGGSPLSRPLWGAEPLRRRRETREGSRRPGPRDSPLTPATSHRRRPAVRRSLWGRGSARGVLVSCPLPDSGDLDGLPRPGPPQARPQPLPPQTALTPRVVGPGASGGPAEGRGARGPGRRGRGARDRGGPAEGLQGSPGAGSTSGAPRRAPSRTEGRQETRASPARGHWRAEAPRRSSPSHV